MTRRNLVITLIVLIILAGGRIMIQQNQTPRVPPTVINAGFESNLLEGWETAGVVETGGYESEKRLTHPGGNAPVESIQK